MFNLHIKRLLLVLKSEYLRILYIVEGMAAELTSQLTSKDCTSNAMYKLVSSQINVHWNIRLNPDLVC